MKHLGLAILLISLSACSMFNRHSEADPNDRTVEKPLADADKHGDNYSADESIQLREAGKPLDDSKPLTDNIAAPTAEPIKADEVDVTANKKSYLDQKYHEPKTDAAPVVTERTEIAYSGKSSGVDPEKALGWLKNGNKRFVKGALRADGQSKKDIKRLAKNEKPHAVVFASSDSRIPPEIIFDEKLGEIHVIRNFGLTVDNSALNSIDYAVGELGVRLVIVLDRSYENGIDFTHADATAQKLVDQSAVLRAGLESKNVKVIPAIYDLASGKVTFGK